MECHDRSACTEADELLGPVRRERELRNNAFLFPHGSMIDTVGNQPPVAGIADVKHHPATRPSTEQLSKHHFSSHRTPARFHSRLRTVRCWRRRLWGIDLGLEDVGEWADGLEKSMSGEIFAIVAVGVALAGVILTSSRGLR